jgi:hypothetical protein
VNNPTPHIARIKYISKKLAYVIFRYQHKAKGKYYEREIPVYKPNIMQGTSIRLEAK